MDRIENSKKFLYGNWRSLNASHFYYTSKNQQKINRQWLVYSEECAKLFCYVCKLFNSNDKRQLCQSGLDDWVHISKRLAEHENSMEHRNAVCTLSIRASTLKRIDQEIVLQHNKEVEYWRNVLKRVIEAIKFISIRGLPFFGDDEKLNSDHNGNFLGILELISKFDPFLENHFSQFGNKGSGNVNYISSFTTRQIVDQMASKVLNHIVTEIKKVKYFGLIVDSTPDIAHVDQLSYILRYVNEEGEVLERFIKFQNIYSHTAKSLTTHIVSLLKELEISINNCIGQSYDNASNMSGKYSGLQAQIKQLSPKAEYVPCAAHSLNLVGISAVESCIEAVNYFGVVQSLYVFFSSSPRRWDLLKEQLKCNKTPLTLKSTSNTRWSADANAVKALRLGYNEILTALSNIYSDDNQNLTTQYEAKTLYTKLQQKETGIMTIIWHEILQRINKVSMDIQVSTTNLSSIVPLYTSLIAFINDVRNNFQNYEKESINLNVLPDYTSKRKKQHSRSKCLDDPNNPGISLSAKENFIYNTHYVLCDKLITELRKRNNAYEELEKKFGFLFKDLDRSEIQKCSKNILDTYSDDLDSDNFECELIQFQELKKSFLGNKFFQDPHYCLKYIRKMNMRHTFPNLDIILQIYLSMPCTNCSSERSFSVLKRIKNRMRSTLTQEKLDSLSLLAINHDVTKQLSFEDVIAEFAKKKRKKCLS